jgi:hypothetical protein
MRVIDPAAAAPALAPWVGQKPTICRGIVAKAVHAVDGGRHLLRHARRDEDGRRDEDEPASAGRCITMSTP